MAGRRQCATRSSKRSNGSGLAKAGALCYDTPVAETESRAFGGRPALYPAESILS